MTVKRLLTLFILCCLLSNAVIGQKVVLKVTDAYFRYNPFNREFRSFLTHLLNDTLLANKEIIKRTDSTLFFFKGTYKKYNSFGLNPARVEIRLAESEINVLDPKKEIDTILLYQLLIYTGRKTKGMDDVQSEFEKFNRKYKGGFSRAESKNLMENNKSVGAIRDYYIDLIPIPPVTIAYTDYESDENVFAITIRIKVKENTALIPQSDYLDTYLDYLNKEKEE